MNLNDLKKLVVLKPWVKPGEAAAILNVSRRRVAGVHDWEKTQRDEFGERTGQSERLGFVGRDAAGVHSPAAVMSLNGSAGSGRANVAAPALP